MRRDDFEAFARAREAAMRVEIRVLTFVDPFGAPCLNRLSLPCPTGRHPCNYCVIPRERRPSGMKSSIVRIGNSRGIRIPKTLLEQCRLGELGSGDRGTR